jgi:hypothetical protein
MRIPTQTEYETAQRALDAYAAFSKPYVQKNGWTAIPADAPRPVFEGAELTSGRVNAFSTTVELFELNRDKPEKVFAYISASESGAWRATTWTGETISEDLRAGRTYRNPRLSYTSNTITPVQVKICGQWYSGRAMGPGIYVKLRRMKNAPARA